jgi:hypothetical protein
VGSVAAGDGSRVYPGMTFQRARDDKREGIPGQARTTQIVNTS